MVEKYEVKRFADGFASNQELQSRICAEITNAYKKFIMASSSQTGKEDSIFSIYLVDIDQIDPKHFRTLLSASPEEQTASLGGKIHRGIFLFLSKSQSYTTWSDNHNREGHAILKENEFYIRTLLSYQLGKFVFYNEAEHELQAINGELKTVLNKLAYQHAQERVLKLREDVSSVQQLLAEISEDAKKFYNIARLEGLPQIDDEFPTGGENEKQSLEDPVPPELLATFFKSLEILYQIGRRPYQESDSKIEEITWLKGFGGSFALKQAINLRLEGPSSKQEEEPLEQMLSKLRAYEIYRDLARWMASGARHWVSKLPEELKVLIIDENLDHFRKEYSYEELYFKRLERIYKAIGKRNIAVDGVSHATLEKLQQSLLEGNKQTKWEVDTFQHFASESVSRQIDISSYHLILLEVEFSKAYLGPKFVQELAAYLDQNARSRRHRTRIIVLSRKEQYGLIQQCLNLGADAYIMKERVYALPARIVQGRILMESTDPHMSQSNFRSLRQLEPQDRAKLHTERIYGHPWNEVDREWLKALPKADLHTHIGTCISLHTIEALSFNTIGYFLSNIKKQEASTFSGYRQDESKYHLITAADLNLEKLEETIERICQVVIWAGILHKVNTYEYPPAKLLWVATNLVLEGRGDENASKSFPDKDVYDALFKRLAHPDLQLAPFEVCSLLVAAICLTGGAYPDKTAATLWSKERDYLEATRARITSKWEYINDIHEWIDACKEREGYSPLHGDKEAAQRAWVRGLVEETTNQCQVITKMAWGRALTENWGGENFSTDLPWQRCFTLVTQRTDKAVEKLGMYFKQALTRLKQTVLFIKDGTYNLEKAKKKLIEIQWPPRSSEDFEMYSLCEFVRIQESPDTTDQTLLRYLWGAGLLGADHLQYPENILLAGKDIVDQAAKDNITYSEIRCATNGYCAGGMSAIDVTDLLRSSFDLAIAYTGLNTGKKSWIRINILLGAKRNKSEEEFQEIVSLLTFYLQRAEQKRHELNKLEEMYGAQIAPKWWKPCQIVGFDLSGDESIHPHRSYEMIKPLFKLSASITIHAGEAATAENIWDAVYNFGARRIGHGLRLRENKRLLDYCIKEGVCIEMCPISNRFTNGFVDVDKLGDYDGSWREHYPLRYSLTQGLDVCISTDNRQLHGGRTLVDDYLCAARMSGGLTKWEILKLIKAGFKHAFLLKSDVEALLTAMEAEVYNIITSKKNR